MQNKKLNFNVVLLSAGSGRRMGSLTSEKPKSLLAIGEKTVLDHMIEAILSRVNGEIVVVTGFQADTVEQHLESQYGNKIITVRNPSYIDDVNIVSVEVGVSTLTLPNQGYFIIETDLLLCDEAWDKVFSINKEISYWICKGQYNKKCTGGIVNVDSAGYVQAVDYQPVYDPAYNGWAKMVGILYVSPNEVGADRKVRNSAILQSIQQYYLEPWAGNLVELPCRVLDLAESYAASFNTQMQFKQLSKDFIKIKNIGNAMIEKVVVADLKHIEGYSKKRVEWLAEKIQREGVWRVPIALDEHHNLVLDGQHRMEVAKKLGLKWVPAVRYKYSDLKVWSLRPTHNFDWEIVTNRVLSGYIYPYKTVKHEFPNGLPECYFNLSELYL